MLPGGTFAAAFAIDPLFHQTSAQFDAGGAKGMLLHNLSVYRRCEIVFDSEDVPDAAAGREMGKGEEEEGEEEEASFIDLSFMQGDRDGRGGGVGKGISQFAPHGLCTCR